MSNSLRTGAWSQDIYQQSATQKYPLDTIRILDDGREFAYAQAGAVALNHGMLTQSAIRVANDSNRAVVAAAAGATLVYVTTGGAVTADFYKDGWMVVNDAGAATTTEGYIYRVKSHPAGTSETPYTLKDPIIVALTTASEVTFTKNRQSLVLIQPFAALTGIITGVPLIHVDINYYFWNQVKGPAAVLAGGTLAIGEEVAPDNAVAGAVEALVHATTWDVTVGVAMDIAADTEYATIALAIPGY